MRLFLTQYILRSQWCWRILSQSHVRSVAVAPFSRCDQGAEYPLKTQHQLDALRPVARKNRVFFLVTSVIDFPTLVNPLWSVVPACLLILCQHNKPAQIPRFFTAEFRSLDESSFSLVKHICFGQFQMFQTTQFCWSTIPDGYHIRPIRGVGLDGATMASFDTPGAWIGQLECWSCLKIAQRLPKQFMVYRGLSLFLIIIY